jgi:hypothetical protein
MSFVSNGLKELTKLMLPTVTIPDEAKNLIHANRAILLVETAIERFNVWSFYG